VASLGGGRWRLRLEGEPAGEAPLPPYITQPLTDPDRYQTVYAREEGSAAAPTAGLHFTPELLARLDVERVTLHIGLDTFRPVESATLEDHEIPTLLVDPQPGSERTAERVLAVARRQARDAGKCCWPPDGPVTARSSSGGARCCELPPAALDAFALSWRSPAGGDAALYDRDRGGTASLR
jgi:hypothetical protein